MNDKIKTTTVSWEFAKADYALLSSTPTTALVFKPEIHQGGVSDSRHAVSAWRIGNDTQYRYTSFISATTIWDRHRHTCGARSKKCRGETLLP